MQQFDRGYADPRWGGHRQVQEAGSHVRKGKNGQKKLEWVQLGQPLVKVQHVF